jgi:hypothetical protein
MTIDALESSLKGGIAPESLPGAAWLRLSINVGAQPDATDKAAASPIENSMIRPVAIRWGHEIGDGGRKNKGDFFLRHRALFVKAE